MADVTFIVHRDWLDSIKGLPLAQQDKIIAEVVRYGTEMEMEYEEEPTVVSFVNLLKGRIDYSKNKYESNKSEKKKSFGRKKRLDDSEILRLAREGYGSLEIANLMGCSKSAIDHSEGWKKRKEKIELKKDGFEF